MAVSDPTSRGGGNASFAARANVRRAFMLALMGAACCRHAAAQGSSEKAASGSDSGGLNRLGLVLEQQLSRRKGAVPLPWQESILQPATSRLVWRPRSVSARPGGDAFRVAFDPATHWFFVAQLAEGSTTPRFFGPLEEARPGVFVEAFRAPPPPPPAASVPGNKKQRKPR